MKNPRVLERYKNDRAFEPSDPRLEPIGSS